MDTVVNGKGSGPRNCFSQAFRDNHEAIHGSGIPDGPPLPSDEPPSKWRCASCGWETPRHSATRPEDMPRCNQAVMRERETWPGGLIRASCGGRYEIVWRPLESKSNT